MPRLVTGARAALARAEEERIYREICRVSGMMGPTAGLEPTRMSEFAFGPGALVPVDGEPAELVEVWRRGDEVAYAHPSQLQPVSELFEVAGVNEAPRKDSLLAARWDYVHDVIDVVEFEARVERVLKAMERRRG